VVAATNYLGNCVVKRGGTTSDFKGFNGLDLEYFVAAPNYQNIHGAEISSCPLCSSPLKEVAELADSIILKCTSCKYSDIYPKTSAGENAA
jgi:hypothetical protein